MRLYILSDLHLEFEPFTPPAIAADAVILAGDVSTGRTGLKWALKSFPDRPVIYVLGNHEFYGQEVQKLIKELQEMAQGTNVHLLENQSCTIGDVLFLGAGCSGSLTCAKLSLLGFPLIFMGTGTMQPS